MKNFPKLILICLVLSSISMIFTSCNSNIDSVKQEKSSEFLERAKEKNDNPIFSWFADTVQYGIENGMTISGNSFGVGFKDNQNHYDFFNPTDWILDKSFSAMDWIMENDVDALKDEIIHTIYGDVIVADSKVVSILNMYGDINISKSPDDKVYVELSLIQNKKIDDLDIKLENLILEPQLIEDILFLEPTNKNGGNYWEYIINDLNANGIMLEFNVQIPNTVEELRVYNDFGNVSIEDIEAKITTQVIAGSISGENLSLLDKSSFTIISGMSNNKAIDLSFKDLKDANNLVVSSVQGDIYLDIPNDVDYNIEIDSNLNIIIDENLNPTINREYCINNFVEITKEETDLTITTNLESYYLRELIIQ